MRDRGPQELTRQVDRMGAADPAGIPGRTPHAAGPVIDGLEPGRVEQPQTAEQLAEALHAAAERGEAAVPVGGGRALGLGGPLERFDVAIETRALNRILEQSQADMTISVE